MFFSPFLHLFDFIEDFCEGLFRLFWRVLPFRLNETHNLPLVSGQQTEPSATLIFPLTITVGQPVMQKEQFTSFNPPTEKCVGFIMDTVTNYFLD